MAFFGFKVVTYQRTSCSAQIDHAVTAAICAPSSGALGLRLLRLVHSASQWRSLHVTGASPHGFPPPAQSPRAEIPAGHEAGALGGAKAADDAEVMFTPL